MHAYLAAGNSPAQIISGIGIWGLIIMAYWAPTLIAWQRHVHNLGSVAVLNFFGFLFITWVVALAWACKTVPPPTPKPPASITAPQS